MKLTATLVAPRIDLDRYKSAAHRFFSWVLAEGARSYLINTASTLPVYGGASRATFSELASKAEYGLSISPVVGPNTISVGMENGTAEFKTDGGRYQFTYYTTLKHLIINENYDATQWGFHLKHPGPYHFQERGRRAFLSAVNVTMPSVIPYIVTDTIKV